MTWRWFDVVASVDRTKVGGIVDFAGQHMWCVWVRNSDDIRLSRCSWRVEGMRALDAADVILVVARIFPNIERVCPWVGHVGKERASA